MSRADELLRELFLALEDSANPIDGDDVRAMLRYGKAAKAASDYLTGQSNERRTKQTLAVADTTEATTAAPTRAIAAQGDAKTPSARVTSNLPPEQMTARAYLSEQPNMAATPQDACAKAAAIARGQAKRYDHVFAAPQDQQTAQPVARDDPRNGLRMLIEYCTYGEPLNPRKTLPILQAAIAALDAETPLYAAPAAQQPIRATYCDCDLEPDEEESASRRCKACGKVICV